MISNKTLVYSFGEGHRGGDLAGGLENARSLLGGKGAALVEMTRLGVAMGANALTFAGRMPEALTVARAAYARAPEDGDTSRLLIRALLRAGAIGEARSRIVPAHRQFPQHLGIQKLYGILGNE